MKIFKYGIVGVIATVINTAILFFTVKQWHWNPMIGYTAGFIIACLTAYVMNRLWTFQSTEGVGRTLYRYLIVSVSSLLMSLFLLWVALHLWHWDLTVANIFVIVIMPFINFSMNHYWTFSATPMEALEENINLETEIAA